MKQRSRSFPTPALLAGTLFLAVAASAADATSGTGPNPFDYPPFLDIGTARIEQVSGGAVVAGYGGHYTVEGPLQQAAYCGYPGKGACDADGNWYFADHTVNQVRAFINGRVCVLAGTGARGLRDNCPAGQAHFNIPPYTLHTTAATGSPAKGDGAVFLVDNDRVRRVQRKDGRWWVDTVAGGGKETIKPGEQKPAASLGLLLWNSVAADLSRPGDILVLQKRPASLVRIHTNGMAEAIDVPAGFGGQGLQTDRKGRVYGWVREGNFTRLDPATGKLETLAVDNPPNRAAIAKEMEAKYGKGYMRENGWDGPADKVEWYCPASYAVDADGAALYAGGGDAWNVRRAKDGFVKTLFSDGKFHIRQAVDEKKLPIYQFGSPCGSYGEWIYLRAGPVDGLSCIIRYKPGRDTEVEGE